MTSPSLRERVYPQYRPVLDWLDFASQFRCVLPQRPGAPTIDLLEAGRRLVSEQPELAAHAIAALSLQHQLTHERFGKPVMLAAICEREDCAICLAAGLRPDAALPRGRGIGFRIGLAIGRAISWVLALPRRGGSR